MEKVKVYRNSIVAKDGSFIQARSADADTAHGYNAHAVLFDELHSQPNRELYDVMKTASGARRQPLFFSISPQLEVIRKVYAMRFTTTLRRCRQEL